jgi:hypothetical protein
MQLDDFNPLKVYLWVCTLYSYPQGFPTQDYGLETNHAGAPSTPGVQTPRISYPQGFKSLMVGPTSWGPRPKTYCLALFTMIISGQI